jgi:hypothetical protein
MEPSPAIVTVTDQAYGSEQSSLLIPSVMYSCVYAKSLTNVNKREMRLMFWMILCQWVITSWHLKLM